MAPASIETAICDLTGVTAVVTGASGGIGLEAARGLAAAGARVVLGVRSAERGQSAASAIRRGCPCAAVEVMVLDLTNLASVHRFAQALGLQVNGLGLLVK
jgi:NAD(P)-dependent dehydrogenase (short-subunit alcohol dehydrogenase family)